MFKNFRDKIALSGITVLMIGITLLIFTFVSAYGFLTAGLSINASGDLTQTFGDALAPLIVTCIHIMYLGVMGWVGSLITIRGVTIIAHAPPMPTLVQSQQPTPEAKLQPHPQTQQLPQKPKTEKPKAEKPMEEKPKEEKPKEEVKVPEPEIIVLPPEQVAQTPPTPEQKPQQNGSPTQ